MAICISFMDVRTGEFFTPFSRGEELTTASVSKPTPKPVKVPYKTVGYITVDELRASEDRAKGYLYLREDNLLALLSTHKDGLAFRTGEDAPVYAVLTEDGYIDVKKNVEYLTASRNCSLAAILATWW